MGIGLCFDSIDVCNAYAVKNPVGYYNYMIGLKNNFINTTNYPNSIDDIKASIESSIFLKKFPTQLSYTNTSYTQRVLHRLITKSSTLTYCCAQRFVIGAMGFSIFYLISSSNLPLIGNHTLIRRAQRS